MDRRELLKMTMATAGWAAVGNGVRAQAPAARGPASLGKFNGFYRGTQLQGHLLSSKQGLQQVPDFLLRTSFPYRKRPQPQEILFTDTISLVRFLGGFGTTNRWKQQGEGRVGKGADLAYVGTDGKVAYRFDLIPPRLDPYLEAGYRELVIDLDNVPWDLSAYPSEGEFGNNAPPRDYREWHTFIEALCRKLVELYGAATVGTWSFRMGAESNGGPNHTWHGSHDEYVKIYDATADAVKRVVPRARFGPGEFSGGILPKGPPPPFVNYVKLFEHCAEKHVPFEFLANSSHGLPLRVGERLQQIAPDRRAQLNLASYRNVIGTSRLPIYIFQFGILSAEFPGDGSPFLTTTEPGGRGAAWTFHVLLTMKEREPRLKGIWHWDTLESLSPGRAHGPETKYLLCGNGWLYAVLDACLGGDAYLLPVPDSAASTLFKALFVRQEGGLTVVMSAFNVDRQVTKPEKVRLRIPQNLMGRGGNWRAKMVTLTDDNSVYSRIRSDLEHEGLLKPEYVRAPVMAEVHAMGKPGAATFVRQHYGEYERLQTESLTLKSFSGSLQASATGLDIQMEMTPGSLTALRLDP
jgi:hypothetical protein